MGACNCPLPTAIETIPTNDCPFDIRQVQKFIFQRAGYVWDTAGGVPTDISTSADWTTLVGATDDTKVAVTPFVGGNPIITAGDVISEGGGDNSTLNGVELVTGTNPSLCTSDFKSISPEQETALKTLMCEDLVVYLVTQDDKLLALDNDVATQSVGIPISAFFFSDRDNQGFATKDTNKMQFSLKAGWSEKLKFVVPESGFSFLTGV